ncbi:hypothetical protein [Nocardia farcinica]|uniref:hypothetical protein n=1 Tax=Nocardia farcinica TaxID=37329 RepID=UPI001892F495|nr:hypothetical protein [Nocardia farcinica]MBF6189427.1 hypothetical protein [Nocardia farcinica]
MSDAADQLNQIIAEHDDPAGAGEAIIAAGWRPPLGVGPGLPRVTIDTDTRELRVDGEPFPWAYAGVEPTIAESPDGAIFPGVIITIACADLQVVKPSEVIPDGDE